MPPQASSTWRECRPSADARQDQLQATDYRLPAAGGVRPAFTSVDAASGDERKRSSATAASGWRAVVVIAPAKVEPGCSSAGMVPTKVTPGTCRSSLTC